VEQRQLGNSGLRVSAIGLGTMTWGRDTDEHEAAEQLRIFTESGGTFIDTAASYCDGDSERVIGGLIGTMIPREEVVIATKAGIVGREIDNSRGALLRDLDESLKRLRTTYVDLWQIHAWDPTVRLEETLSAMDIAVNSGRVRYVGISNFSGWQSARAITLQSSATGAGRAEICATHNEYSLLNRKIEKEVLPCSENLGVGVLAWSPLGRGVLTGKYQNGIPADSRGASPHLGPFVANYLDARSKQIVTAVSTAADGLGAAPLEIALSWVRDAPGISSAIIGARTSAQLRGALRSNDLVLPDLVRSALNDISEAGD
jgi:aryl-alcohol dehydrogenase-like predicted oxidoreductase